MFPCRGAQLKHGVLTEIVAGPRGGFAGGKYSKSLPEELGPGLFGGDVSQKSLWDFSGFH